MTKKTTPAVERLARRLIAELAQRRKERPWANVEKLQEGLGLDQRQIAKALLAAAARGWINVDPLAAKGEAYPHSVSLTGDGWIAAVRQRPPKAGRPRRTARSLGSRARGGDA